MGPIFCSNGRRSDGPIAPLGSDHEFFLAEIPPIRYSFIPASLPLLLSQHSILLRQLLYLHLLHLLVVGRLLQLGDMLLLVLEVLEYFQAVLLVLFLIGGLRQ